MAFYCRAIMQFSQNPAVSEPRPGGKLMMYAGMIEGEYDQVTENRQLVLKWKFRDWDAYSKVVIDFEEDDDVRMNKSTLNTFFL